MINYKLRKLTCGHNESIPKHDRDYRIKDRVGSSESRLRMIQLGLLTVGKGATGAA